MTAEDNEVPDLDYVRLIIVVLFLDVVEDVEFDESLLVKLLLVADNLQRDDLLAFVVHHFQHLSE